MTRVILTNKQTGQELPEAELVSESSTTLAIQFDGAFRHNVFSRSEWDYREVRAFRNGDVLRRKDRKVGYVHFVYDEAAWAFARPMPEDVQKLVDEAMRRAPMRITDDGITMQASDIEAMIADALEAAYSQKGAES